MWVIRIDLGKAKLKKKLTFSYGPTRIDRCVTDSLTNYKS